MQRRGPRRRVGDRRRRRRARPGQEAPGADAADLPARAAPGQARGRRTSPPRSATAGVRPFTYKTLGVFVDMGQGKAVAEHGRDQVARAAGVAAGPQLPPGDDARLQAQAAPARRLERPARCSAATCPSSAASGTRRRSPSRRRPAAEPRRAPGRLMRPRRPRLVDRRGRSAAARCPRWPATSTADVVIVGGGYTGMWAAWHVLEAEPGARVVVLEADRCGFGPSGRNGGFVQSMDVSRPMLVRALRAARRRRLLAAARELGAGDRRLVRARGRRRLVPRRAAPDRLRRAGPGRRRRARRRRRDASSRSSAEEVRARCDSPVMRGGVLVAAVGATVHPARLAFGLRERLLRARRADLRGHARARARRRRRRAPTAAACARPVALVAAGASTGAAAAAAPQPDRRLEPHRPHRARARRHRGDRLDRRRGDQRRPHAAALPAHDARRAHPVRLGGRPDGRGRAAGRAHGGRPRRHRAHARRPRPLLPGARGPPRSSARGAGRSTSRPPTCRSSARCPAGARTPPSATRATASGRRTWPAARWPTLALGRRDGAAGAGDRQPDGRRAAARAAARRRRGR